MQQINVHYLKHPFNYYGAVQLEKESSKLVCYDCLIPLILNNQNQTNAISIQLLLNTENHSVDLFPKNEFNELQFTIYDKTELIESLQNFEQSIVKIQSLISNLLENVRNVYQELLIFHDKSNDKIDQYVNIQKFQTIISNLQSDKQTKISQEKLDNINSELHQYFNKFKSGKHSLINFIEEIQQNKMKLIQQLKNDALPQIKNLNEEIIQLVQQQEPLLLQYFQFPYNSKLLDNKLNLKYILQSKAKKQIQNAQLIYLGSRDGLNANAFWSKCNLKNNLLMVFKSKNKGDIFGGYSPCQWNKDLIRHQKDNTSNTFIFSQTHKQIYSIKDVDYAIYCNKDQGPTYGRYDDDLNIASNFTDGYSLLNHTYKADQYNIENYRTHLYGGQKPNIEECEIFEINYI